MSEEQLKALIEKVQGDDNLQEKLKAAANPDVVVSIAKEAGLGISADDLNKAQTELSEEELEGVAGGRYIEYNKTSRFHQDFEAAKNFFANLF